MSVGSVLQRLFGLIAAAPLPVLGLSLLLGALPRVAMAWGLASLTRFGVTTGTWLVMAAGWSGSSLVSIALTVLVQGAIVRVAVAVADGGRVGIGESLGAALRVLPALLVVAIVSAVGVGVGLVLLAVPGILLATIWSVAAPALVAERLGPFAALGRSRWLTRGHRPAVFGLLALLLVLSWIAGGVFQSTMLPTFGLRGGGGAFAGTAPTAGWAIASLIFETLTAAVWACAHAVLYVELRDAREGPGEARLAPIFACTGPIA
jgi:hypothetical protein